MSVAARGWLSCRLGQSLMSAFDDLVVEFIRAEKTATRRFRWLGRRLDWVRTGVPLIVDGRRDLAGKLELSAHLYRRPEKYSFSLLFQGKRVIGLDVNPGLAHFNTVTLMTVIGTHWQSWPSMTAVPDTREFIHHQWLDEFLKLSRIVLRFPPVSPPFGSQLRLDI
jgi:hypothetical protein